MKKENKIKFGIPNGFLKESIEKLFKMNGYDFRIDEKLSTVYIDDSEIECFLARAREIAPLIDKGILDGGILSRVIIAETKVNLKEIYNLETLDPAWEETRLVLAAPEKSQIKSIKDLKGKKIITRVPKITEEFLERYKTPAIIEFSDSSNESRVPAFADAVVEFTNTGTVLKFYNLKILAVLMKDSIIVAANPKALKNKWKKEKIENLGLLLKGARLAQEYNGLILHASNNMMEEVLKTLPALKKPTITHLRGENWFEVFTVAEIRELRELIPILKKIGCTDIIEFSLNKVIV